MKEFNGEANVSGCRNCGGKDVKDLGAIGQIAPFFLKRVLGLEVRYPWTTNLWKQRVRTLATSFLSFFPRLSSQFAFAEMQVCFSCSFIQTRSPFRDDDIMRLYSDYRADSYNKERIQFEPSYAAIAAQVGQDRKETATRKSALTDFLNRSIVTDEASEILDYGGSDGRFLPDIPGVKWVYEISNIAPIRGVTRIHTESELRSYELVLLAHVVEHVTHPLDLVTKVASYVRPGGYLYIETPQEIGDDSRNILFGEGPYFRVFIHEHINSYCPLAVKRLLSTAGFDVVSIESGEVDVGWAKAVHIRALGQKPH